jgi:hypothetical protein
VNFYNNKVNVNGDSTEEINEKHHLLSTGSSIYFIILVAIAILITLLFIQLNKRMTKVLFVVAPKDFRDEEYFVPKTILEQNDFRVETASLNLGEITGAGGKNAQAEILA